MSSVYINSAVGGSHIGTYANPYATLVAAQAAHSGDTTGMSFVGMCGHSESLTTTNTVSLNVGGTSGSNPAIYDCAYDSAGSPVLGVSGNKPEVKGEYWGGGLLNTTYPVNAVIGAPLYIIQQNNSGFALNRNYKCTVSGDTGASYPSNHDVWYGAVGATFTWGAATIQVIANLTESNAGLMGIGTGHAIDYLMIRNWQINKSYGTGIRSQSHQWLEMRGVDMNIAYCMGFLNQRNQTHIVMDECTIRGTGRVGLDKGNDVGVDIMSQTDTGNDITFTNFYIENEAIAADATHAAVGANGEAITACQGTTLQDFVVFNGSNGVQLYINNTRDMIANRFAFISSVGIGDGINFTVELNGGGLRPSSIDNSNNKITNFLMAGLHRGLYVESNAGGRDTTHGSMVNSTVAFFTIADCATSARTNNNTVNSGSVIMNGVFANYNNTMTRTIESSISTGVTWDYNNWDTTPSAPLSGAHDVIGDPLLYGDYLGEDFTVITPSVSINSDGSFTTSGFTPELFQPIIGSPVLGAGKTVAGITTDYLGNSRNGSSPDMGAFHGYYQAGGGSGTNVGTLVGSLVDDDGTSPNLTTDGNLGWLCAWRLGSSAIDTKSGGTRNPTSPSFTGTPAGFTASGHGVKPLWTDGTPTGTFTASAIDGVYVSGVGNGYTSTVQVDNETLKIIVHCSVYNGTANVTITLDDDSSTSYTVNFSADASAAVSKAVTVDVTTNYNGTATIAQHVTVGASCNVGLQAITVGGPNTPVPNTTGEDNATTHSDITAAGLTVGTDTDVASVNYDIGKTVSTAPSAGTLVSPGATINVNRSKGTQQPDVSGNTEAVATSALLAAGFAYTVTYVPNGGTTIGTVKTQSGTPGNYYDPVTTVDLQIAYASATISDIRMNDGTLHPNVSDITAGIWYNTNPIDAIGDKAVPGDGFKGTGVISGGAITLITSTAGSHFVMLTRGSYELYADKVTFS